MNSGWVVAENGKARLSSCDRSALSGVPAGPSASRRWDLDHRRLTNAEPSKGRLPREAMDLAFPLEPPREPKRSTRLIRQKSQKCSPHWIFLLVPTDLWVHHPPTPTLVLKTGG